MIKELYDKYVVLIAKADELGDRLEKIRAPFVVQIEDIEHQLLKATNELDGAYVALLDEVKAVKQELTKAIIKAASEGQIEVSKRHGTPSTGWWQVSPKPDKFAVKDPDKFVSWVVRSGRKVPIKSITLGPDFQAVWDSVRFFEPDDVGLEVEKHQFSVRVGLPK